jgi:glycosyltransferase involved in cell wall biosynthesis
MPAWTSHFLIYFHSPIYTCTRRNAASRAQTLWRELSARQFELGIGAPTGFHLDIPEPPQVHQVPIRGRSHLFADNRAAHTLARLVSDYDLVHAHGLRAAWITSLACNKTGRPYLFTSHNLAPRTAGITRLLLRMTANRAKRIIAVSNAVSASLVRNGIEESRIRVIPNGIDLSPFEAPVDRNGVLAELCLPADSIVVAAAGRLSPEKGFDTLVRAGAIVAANWPTVRFILAGEGSEHGSLATQISQNGLEDHFLLLGRRDDIPRLFAASDIVAIPSVLEGQGLVALEAMAARKPVLASKVGGLIETIVEGETGVLTAPGNPVAFANSLEPLISDSVLRQKLAMAGRQRVEREYTSQIMAERTVELYRSLL